jgi:NAD+ kinase
VQRIGLVVHHGRPAALAAAAVAERWCVEHEVSSVEGDVWGDSPRKHSKDEVLRAGPLDLVVTIGGDGTFLRGARIAGAANCPVLGVNAGRVGFLTDVDPSGLPAALDAVAEGTVREEERLTLTLRASRELRIPSGLELLLRYGRGPALPPPMVRDGSAQHRPVPT